MKFKRFYAILLGLVLATALSVAPVYAEEKHTMEHGTPSEAAVSEEVDIANNTDNSMSTTMFVYIPPDPAVKDVPDMGDSGLDLNILCLAAIGVGVAYLGCNRYACQES